MEMIKRALYRMVSAPECFDSLSKVIAPLLLVVVKALYWMREPPAIRSLTRFILIQNLLLAIIPLKLYRTSHVPFYSS